MVHALDESSIESLWADDSLPYAQIHINIAVHLLQRLGAASWA